MAEGSAEDDLDEYEVEEEDVYVELHGLVDPSQLYQCTVENSRVLGIDTERPIFKLGNYTFAGNFQDTLGTAVFFNTTGDGEDKKLDYYCHTTQSISANRVMIYPKNNDLLTEDEDFADSYGVDKGSEKLITESGNDDSVAKEN